MIKLVLTDQNFITTGVFIISKNRVVKAMNHNESYSLSDEEFVGRVWWDFSSLEYNGAYFIFKNRRIVRLDGFDEEEISEIHRNGKEYMNFPSVAMIKSILRL